MGNIETTIESQLESLRCLRTRIHNIATGAEVTDGDNEALNLIARLCESTYRDVPGKR